MHITIAVCGFQHEVWQKQFFPEDLPEDWRFDYYANEFDSIFLSVREQQSLGEEWLEQAMREAENEFVFVLEVEEPYSGLFKSIGNVLSVKFSSKEVEVLSDVAIEVGEIIYQHNAEDSACVLRVIAVRALKNEDLKQVLMYVYDNYDDFSQAFLFFGQNCQGIEVINTTKIINDLL